jgi:hypothetical protein
LGISVRDVITKLLAEAWRVTKDQYPFVAGPFEADADLRATFAPEVGRIILLGDAPDPQRLADILGARWRSDADLFVPAMQGML